MRGKKWRIMLKNKKPPEGGRWNVKFQACPQIQGNLTSKTTSYKLVIPPKAGIHP